MKLSKSILIDAPLQIVYGVYADINLWKEVMDDVINVKVYYDDSRHQEFDMTVLREGKKETVHSIRFCYPCSAIEIFQTKPPPSMKTMSGVWEFSTHENKSLVKATRNFEIKEGNVFNQSILEKFLDRNLSSFKKWIEDHV